MSLTSNPKHKLRVQLIHQLLCMMLRNKYTNFFIDKLDVQLEILFINIYKDRLLTFLKLLFARTLVLLITSSDEKWHGFTGFYWILFNETNNQYSSFRRYFLLYEILFQIWYNYTFSMTKVNKFLSHRHVLHIEFT